MVSDGGDVSNWRKGLATKLGFVVALFVAVAAIGAGWNYGLKQERVYEQEARQAYSDQAKNGCDQIAQPKVQSTTFKQSDSKPCTPDENAKQENDNLRNYTDLVAQRSSALWAKIMGIAALIGMGLSLVGVALVWTTFRETRKANDIAKAADRPWLGFKPTANGHLQINFDDFSYQISIAVTNHGVRPATSVNGRISAFLDTSGTTDLAVISEMQDSAINSHQSSRKADHFITIFPGQLDELHLAGTIPITGLITARIRLIILVEYCDPSTLATAYTIESFDIHTSDSSILRRENDTTKFWFHQQQNCSHMANFEIYKIREFQGIAN